MKANVYVFQTSVQSSDEINQLKAEIERIPEIMQWNFDLDDPEFRVFRIVSIKNISNQVISLFDRFNLNCSELPDDQP